MAKCPAPVADTHSTPWMTRQDVARYFGVDIQTIDNMAADGRLKKYALGRIVRFHRDEVDAAMMGALA
jgi:excisionase family DNA binding protein